MANIIDVLKKYIAPFYYYILVIVFIIIFILTGYYGYTTFYGRSAKEPTKDVANANRRSVDVTVLFFHVEWCPHCKKALPEWKQFSAQFNGKEINGYVIKCIEMDCTNETSEITTAINRYNIEYYPTIKMLKDEEVIEFDSKITKYSLEQFVDKMTA